MVRGDDEIVCWTNNSETGLFYNLTAMIRPSNSEDFSFSQSTSNNFETTFVNICSAVKEYSAEETPVCDQIVTTSFPYLATTQSYGSLSQEVFLPYQPNTTADGITVNYNSNDVCGDSSTYQSSIHVLCDLSVEVGVIDNTTTSTDGCATDVFMRSRYGCGFTEGEPLTCSDYITVDPVACTTNGKANFNCQAGEFVVSVTGNQNVPKYSFYMLSDYSYDYDYDTQESAYDDSDADNTDEPYGGSYKIQFQKLFETDSNGKEVNQSQVSLPSLSWEMTLPTAVLYDDDECTQETTFNITNTDGPNWSKLVFVNHLSMAGNTSSLKFDVVVEDYVWVGDDTSNLVLSINYNSDAGSNASMANSTSATVGNSYLNIAPIAYGYPNSSDPLTNETISATYTNSGGLEISYSHFTGSLVHDPTFGIKLPTPTPPSAPCSDNECNFQSYSLAASSSSTPSVSFTYDSNEWTVYFASLREVQVSDDGYTTISSSLLAFGDYSWTVSTPESAMLPDGTAQVSFNVSTGASDRWESISLFCASSMKAGVSHFNVTAEIKNYVWVSDDSATSLQLELDIGGPGSIYYSFDTVLVGDAYIQATVFATANSTSNGIQVPIVSMFYSDAAFVTISHFTGSLSSSLVMGVNSDSDSIPIEPTNLVAVEGEAEADGDYNEDNGDSDWWIWLLVSVGLFATVAVVAVVAAFVVIKHRKKTAYDSL